jgi:hypothetical protein
MRLRLRDNNGGRYTNTHVVLHGNLIERECRQFRPEHVKSLQNTNPLQGQVHQVHETALWCVWVLHQYEERGLRADQGVQYQDFADGIPSLRSAEGSIAFQTQMEGWKMLESPENKTMKGGGIEAEVLIVSMDAFKVTGPVTETSN